ncbi:MAG: ThuA domain-containing protein [Bellilinea sp.]|nr:ThuA domain-containing protein [Bellilinea sp.]
MKRVWLVSDGWVHPPLDGRLALRRTLQGIEGVDLRTCRRLEHLPEDLSDVAALVLYYHHRDVEEVALRRVMDYVRGGGGVLAVHSASASFKTNPAYFELLGGRFIGHGKVQRLQFHRRRDDLFSGITEFTLRDELYHHEFQPGVEVHWTALADGEQAPVVWTYRYGSGRVCYLLPGHLGGSLRHPSVQEMVRIGLAWVSAGEGGKP